MVQDPADALVPFMPLNAVTHVKVDYCLPLGEIAPLLVKLTSATAEEEGAFQVPKEVEIEVNVAKREGDRCGCALAGRTKLTGSGALRLLTESSAP